jgi:hypothetical protein
LCREKELKDARRERSALLSIVRQYEKKGEIQSIQSTAVGSTAADETPPVAVQAAPVTTSDAAAPASDADGHDRSSGTPGGSATVGVNSPKSKPGLSSEKQSIRDQLNAFSDGDY